MLGDESYTEKSAGASEQLPPLYSINNKRQDILIDTVIVISARSDVDRHSSPRPQRLAAEYPPRRILRSRDLKRRRAAMFQPQSTYYADFVYGATTSQPPLSDNVYNYDQIPTQQNQQQQSQQLRSRGPVTFSTPNFSAAPTGLWGNIGSAPQQQIPLRPLQRQQQQQYDITDILPKMEASDGDYEAQQALANGYAPSLEVSCDSGLWWG